MAQDNMKFIMMILSGLITLLLLAYAAKLIKSEMVEKALKEPIFRIVVLMLILMLFASGLTGQALLLLIVYCLEVSRSNIEGFAPYSKDYKVTNMQTLVEPTNEIYPGCLKITAQDLLNEFSGDKLALQNTVLSGYSQLVKSIPKSSSSRETLDTISRAVGLPHSVDLSDDTAPLIATLLIVQGFKLSESCQSPTKDIQNSAMQLLDGSVVSPFDEGDYHKY